jgi:hypothetical protein
MPGGLGNPAVNHLGSLLLKSRPATAKTRAVFYSFHYRDVMRVAQVRNAGMIRIIDRGRHLTPIDRGIWDKAKTSNPSRLGQIIDNSMHGTSVTCILAGYETWSRPWVRYEIARSLARGNGLLTVYIDQCRCPNEGLGLRGPNPLDYMALGYDSRIYEFTGNSWRHYSKILEPVPSWPKWLPRPRWVV